MTVVPKLCRAILLALGLAASPLALAGPSPLADPQIASSLAQWRGSVVLVDFWASWCAACKESLPRLMEMQRDFAGRGFTVLAVNVDETREKASRFLRGTTLTYPVIYDPQGHWPERFEVKGMPAAFVLDREGAVRHAYHGYRERDLAAIRGAVEALLGETRR